jgi:hypothetical protein
MAQYDLLLTQNVAESGVEFSEKYVNIGKGAILSGAVDGTPTVLAAGTNGYMLIRDDTTATGLKWEVVSGGHTQNTDTGTTGNTFTIDSDSTTGKIILDVALGAADVALTLTNAELTEARTITFPDATGTVALTSQLPSNPLTYKGAIDCGANPNYPAAAIGDTYVVSVAGKIGGASGPAVEAGDTLYCIDTAAEGDHATVGAKWVIVQKNLDGAVIGPASVGDGYLVLFDGVTGKLIKAGTGAPGTMVYETATDFVAKSLFDANTLLFATSDNTPVALLGTELMPKIWAAVPADKIGTGYTGTAIAGQIAKDANWVYICETGGTATNQVWTRFPKATNWTN